VGFLIITLISWLGYLETLAPGLTWQHSGADGGDLIAAVYTHGIPHPPGYPTYVLLARLFTVLPVGTPAYRMNLFSALSAALAVGFVFLTARHLLRAMKPPSSRLPATLAGIAALTLAFSPTLWSQAVITEVYALNAAFVALLWYSLVRIHLGGEDMARWPEIAAVAFGVGLGDHLTLALILPSMFLLYASAGLPRTRQLRLVLLAFAGSLVYAYLPLTARTWPPVNWGNPQNLAGFWWQISGGPYRQYMFGLPPSLLPARLIAWGSLLARQFGPIGLTLALLGGWHMWRTQRRLAVALATHFGLTVTYAIGYNTTDSYVYLIPSYVVAALFLAIGLERALRAWPAGRWRSGYPALVTSVTIAVLLPGWNWAVHHPEVSLREEHTARAYVEAVFQTVEANAVILADEDRYVFALTYYRLVERPETDVTILADGLLGFGWYRDTLQHNGEKVNWPLSATLEDVIASELPDRPVYVTTPHRRLSRHFRLRRLADGLYRVQPRMPAAPPGRVGRLER